METHLLLYLSSEGEKPSAIVKKLKELGFKVAIGRYDMAYSWEKMPSEGDILALGDKVTNALKGMRVLFKLESK